MEPEPEDLLAKPIPRQTTLEYVPLAEGAILSHLTPVVGQPQKAAVPPKESEN